MCFDLEPDVVCITETWTKQEHTRAFLGIMGYTIACREDRKDTTAGCGGGLLIYVRNDIAPDAPESVRPEYTSFNQCVAVKLPIRGGKSIELVLVYRPHRVYQHGNADIVDDVKANNAKLANLFKCVSKPSVLLGDFNCSDVDWEASQSGSNGRFLLEAAQGNFFSQHVDFPTIATAGTRPDLVFSSRSNLILSVENAGKLGSSDHTMLMVEIAGKLPAQESTELVPDWAKANMAGLKQDLSTVDWVAEIQDCDCEEAWTKFKARLDEVQAKHVPLKKRRCNRRPVWMNARILRTIRKKRKLWKRYSQSRDYEDHQAYKRVEKEVQRSVRKAKRDFERKLAKSAKSNPKQFYSYIKSKTANRESVGPLKDGAGVTTESGRIAELLNNFFSSVFTTEDLNNKPEPETLYHGDTPMHNVEITAEKVQKKLEGMRATAAPGPDRIAPRLLKDVAGIVASPLACIFSKSLQEGVVPQDWRSANVTPIFKKGSKTDVGNYRPVSLTSVLCKAMESVLKDALMEHLINNQLLNDTQHGFLQGRSCLTNLLEYLNLLTRLVDEGHSVDVLYLDFSKAFDKVPHARLIDKLASVGIGGPVLQWIRAWLTGRMQRVVLNGSASEWLPVLSGVPQGSVLGPLLFLVFINDIDGALDLTTSVIFKFADDSKVLHKVESEEDRKQLQEEIDNLCKWSEDWQMLFNAGKCKVLHFGRNNPRFCYTMGGYAPAGTVITSDTEEKDIGVLIHESLKPSKQCAKAASKGHQVLGQMYRAVTYRDRDNWLKLYKLYIRPHLENSVQSWSPWLDADKLLLENVQKRALRLTSGLSSRCYEEQLKEVGLTTLEARRERGDMIQVWKYLNHQQAVDPAKLFRMRSDVTDRATRAADPLALADQPSRGDVRGHFFNVRVTRSWNALPSECKHAPNINCFKARYDALINV